MSGGLNLVGPPEGGRYLNDRPTLQELIEVQRRFGLPDPALVEKDWLVVKALAAIVAA
jgi:hypothetical protein